MHVSADFSARYFTRRKKPLFDNRIYVVTMQISIILINVVEEGENLLGPLPVLLRQQKIDFSIENMLSRIAKQHYIVFCNLYINTLFAA